MTQTNKDKVFHLIINGDEIWRCVVNGRIFGDWRGKAEATAGMQTEQRRAAARS